MVQVASGRRGRLDVEQAVLGLGEADALGVEGPVVDGLDVDADGAVGGDQGHPQVAAVGDGHVQLAGEGPGHPGLAAGIVGDCDLAREHGPVAALPEPGAHGVLGRDPAQEPVALAAGVEGLVLGPLGGVEVAPHHQLSGGGAWPALTDQAPPT